MVVKRISRNVWAASLTSFLMDISSEMVLNLIPLFLANVLGVKGTVIGAIEGVAESLASLLRVVSGYVSDRLRRRKWLAVAGYGIFALCKPIFYFAGSWWHVALARWGDRVGKGIRTAPRDALVADSVDERNRGLAFGLHRAADTAGAFLGIGAALVTVMIVQGGEPALQARTFRALVLASLVPAGLAVLALAALAKEPKVSARREAKPLRIRGLGKSFAVFLLLVSLFELGNSADAFLVLRAQTLGASVLSVLGMLAVFNFCYSVVSTPAGALSDRLSRRSLILGLLRHGAGPHRRPCSSGASGHSVRRLRRGGGDHGSSRLRFGRDRLGYLWAAGPVLLRRGTGPLFRFGPSSLASQGRSKVVWVTNIRP